MWWFKKVQPKEVWDDAVEGPIGDIEAAHKIRVICRSAADSARAIGIFTDGPENKKKSDIRQNQKDRERFERAAKAAMAIAMKISDELLRDTAVRQIVELCMSADDSRTAKILFRAIQSEPIRQAVVKEHPRLAGE